MNSKELELMRLRAALVPLMIAKAEYCDGQIGWRGTSARRATAGEILVEHILAAERALRDTKLVEDAQKFVEHRHVELHGADVANRPHGPCDCSSCSRIRSALALNANLEP